LAPTNAAMPTLLSPPGVFSITTDWFHFVARRSERRRAPISVPLPGPSVRMKRTERVGQACGGACVWAHDGPTDNAIAIRTPNETVDSGRWTRRMGLSDWAMTSMQV